MSMQCVICNESFTDGSVYMRHFGRKHKEASAADYWAARDGAKWLNDRKELPSELTASEAHHVQPGRDTLHFQCVCGAHLLKSNAAKHFSKCNRVHGAVDPEEYKQWVVVKDGYNLKHNWSLTHLEDYFEAPAERASPAAASAPVPNTNPAEEQPASPTVRVSSSMGSEDNLGSPGAQLQDKLTRRATKALDDGDFTLFKDLFERAKELRVLRQHTLTTQAAPAAPQSQPQSSQLLHEIKKLQQGGESVPVPQVRIAQHALEFNGKKMSRTPWPWPPAPEVTIEGFKEYMVPRRVKKNTFDDNQAMGMRYLFQLLSIDESNYSDIGVIQALHDQGVLEELVKLHIMDPCFSWTLKITAALKHCVAFMLIQCEQKDLGPARKALTLLMNKTIKDTLKACQDYRKEAKQARKELDEERLRNYMSLETAKETLRESMIDLEAACRINEGKASLSEFWQRVVSINVAWQMVMQGTFARSGELENLYEIEVLESRASGRTFVIISRHKTVKKRGKLGRHFTDAMWKAVECNSSLPPLEGSTYTDEKKPFLRPSRPQMVKAGLYSLLKSGGRIFCPKNTFPRTNLQRKWITTAVRKDENVEKCEAWVAEYNAHLLQTAKDNYLIETVEEQAIKGKTMIKAFFGTPVEWPTGDQLPQETVEEAEARLREKYGRSFKEDDDLDEESDALESSDCDSDVGEEGSSGKTKDGSSNAKGAGMAKGSGRAKGAGRASSAPKRIEEGDDKDGGEGAAKHNLAVEAVKRLDSYDADQEYAAYAPAAPPASSGQLEPTPPPSARFTPLVADIDHAAENELKLLLDAQIDGKGKRKSAGDDEKLRQSRGFTYNPKERRFIVREVSAPNIIDHPPLSTPRQTTLDDHAERAKDKKETKKEVKEEKEEEEQNKLSPADEITFWMHMTIARTPKDGMPLSESEKTFLILQHRLHLKDSNTPPSTSILDLIIEKGKELNMLVDTCETTVKFRDKVRSFLTNFLKIASRDDYD